ncbi:U4/U6.U5 tri-snRNP-associated protein, partial [Trifolium pratense]
MKQTRTKKQSEPASNISSLVNKSRKIENQRVLAVEGSDHTDHHLAGVKVLHGGLDKVAEGGTVVLTIKDQPILADGDLNEDVDMLENVEIGEQKRRDHAYKAAKKTSIYDDKFNDDPSAEKKILPKYDDSAAEESLTLDERGRFSGEAEKKLEELQRRPIGVSSNKFEDLTSYGKVSSSDYYSREEMLQFKKSKKKKSLRKKDKLDINALEAESISLGLDVGDLGWRKDAKRKTIQDEQERLARNNAYQFA